MSALERRSEVRLAWRRWLTVSLVLVAIALASLVSAAPGAAQETPTPTETPGLPGAPDLSFDVTCTPDTFRPNEYVAVECISRFANQSQDPLSDIRLDIISSAVSGRTPSYFFMWSTRDGELLPVGTGQLGFEVGDLEPGQTLVTSTVVLLNMDEGTFETELRASVGEQVIHSVPIRFVATPGAAEPLTDLLVTMGPVGEVGVEPRPTATYETTITNQSSGEVTDLRLTERYGGSTTLVGAEPAPASQDPGLELASWDLASFGSDSLAPGGSLVLRTTYGPSGGLDCAFLSSGVVVEATVGGQEQRYAARITTSAPIGDCPYVVPGIGGGGELAVTLPRGGEGPAPPGGESWAAAALAGTGLALIGAGLAVRRRDAGYLGLIAEPRCYAVGSER